MARLNHRLTSRGPSCGKIPKQDDNVFIEEDIVLTQSFVARGNISISPGAILKGNDHNLEIRDRGKLKINGTLIIRKLN